MYQSTLLWTCRGKGRFLDLQGPVEPARAVSCRPKPRRLSRFSAKEIHPSRPLWDLSNCETALIRVGGDNRVGNRKDRESDTISTPTLRMSLATCAFTVLSSMPSVRAISRLDRAATRSLSTCLACGELRRGRDCRSSRPGRAIDENGQYPAWGPNGSLVHNLNGLFDLLGLALASR